MGDPVNMADARVYPTDEIAPEHEAIHSELDAWGRWNRERRKRIRCGSVEREHRSTGYRSYNMPGDGDYVITLPPSARCLALDRAVLEVPIGHQLALKLNYVNLSPAWLVVRRCRLRPADFGRWMHDARCMVLNLLRRHGA